MTSEEWEWCWRYSKADAGCKGINFVHWGREKSPSFSKFPLADPHDFVHIWGYERALGHETGVPTYQAHLLFGALATAGQKQRCQKVNANP